MHRKKEKDFCEIRGFEGPEALGKMVLTVPFHASHPRPFIPSGTFHLLNGPCGSVCQKLQDTFIYRFTSFFFFFFSKEPWYLDRRRLRFVSNVCLFYFYFFTRGTLEPERETRETTDRNPYNKRIVFLFIFFFLDGE